VRLANENIGLHAFLARRHESGNDYAFFLAWALIPSRVWGVFVWAVRVDWGLHRICISMTDKGMEWNGTDGVYCMCIVTLPLPFYFTTNSSIESRKYSSLAIVIVVLGVRSGRVQWLLGLLRSDRGCTRFPR
jgi:hypothetical protein